MFFDFQSKTPVSKTLYARLASTSMIWVHKRKESLSTQFISQLPQVFWFFVVSYSHADSVACIQIFLLFEELFDAKVLLIGHAVRQNYVFIVFQSEATKNNSND